MHADGLIVDFVRNINFKRCDGRVGCWVDVLVSLPAKDRALQASSSFVIYAELADDRIQNWFHCLNIDGLQYQYWFADEVSASSMLVNGSNLT